MVFCKYFYTIPKRYDNMKQNRLYKEMDDSTIKVGDILYATGSWDYNRWVHWYKVVDVKKTTVMLQRLEGKHISGYENHPDGAQYVPSNTPTKDAPIRVRVKPDGKMSEPGRYGNPIYKWDGEPKTQCMMNEAKHFVKESYEVSPELEDRLNSILADEFLAAEFYRLAELAMKGNKQHRLSEIADENGEDELEDHFKNLSEWMQSKGIRVVTNHDEMLDITNGSVFTVEDGDSTKDIVDKLIQSEEEAIEAYEDLIPDTDLDLHTMLCGFLKDEREHLKALKDAKDEMGGSEDEARKPKHTIYEGRKMKKVSESLWADEEGYEYRVRHIAWDVDDPSELDDLPEELVVTVPEEIVADDGEEEYISDYLTDEYGFCHNGFLYDPVGEVDEEEEEY